MKSIEDFRRLEVGTLLKRNGYPRHIYKGTISVKVLSRDITFKQGVIINDGCRDEVYLEDCFEEFEVQTTKAGVLAAYAKYCFEAKEEAEVASLMEQFIEEYKKAT